MISETVARALNHTEIVPRRELEIQRIRKPIDNYLVRIKAQCQTYFGVRRDFSDAERTSWRWLEYSLSFWERVRVSASKLTIANFPCLIGLQKLSWIST
jgi:hypothetical protein